MKKVILLLVFLFGISSAQLNFRIGGRIIDPDNNESLSGANVYLSQANIGTVSDADGFFLLKANKEKVKNDTLVVSFLGYNEYRIAVKNYKPNALIKLKPKKLELNQTIQVLGERLNLARQEIPHMREEINVDELERYGTSEISDLFKKMPSVRIEGNDLDGRRIQIRGSNASEVNVYLDGILINNLSFDNAADLSVIPTESISKLEVMKGANLPLLGNGAFGGVLNIQSKKEVKPEVMVKSKIGNFNSRHLIGYINLPVIKNLYINYFGQYNEMKPEIEYFSGERFSKKTTSAYLQSYKQNHALNLDYYCDYGQLRAKFFTYFFNYDKPAWFSDRKNFLYAFTFTGKNDLNLSMSLLDSEDNIKRYTIESTQYLSDYNSNHLNLKLSKKFTYKVSSLQLLSEYLHDELESRSTLKSVSSKRTFYKASLYDNRASLSAIWSFEDKYDSLGALNWRTFIGLRGDISASGHKDITHSLGVQVNLRKNNWLLSPYLNYGKNVKYPTLLESAYVNDIVTISSTDTVQNLLEPEYNNSVEIGSQLRYKFSDGPVRNLNFGLALFRNTIYNKILRRPLGDIIYPSQIGRNITKGAEASVKAEQVLKYFNLSASYTKLDIGNPLLYEYKPALNYNFQLDFQAPFGFYASAVYFFEGKSYAWYFDTANELTTERLDASDDFDASVGYRLKVKGLAFNFQFAGYNILDNGGYDYYYLKKRYLQFSFSIKY